MSISSEIDLGRQVREIYKYLKKLRGSGVKMKDIASKIDVPPSVLSAFYASVLPIFIQQSDTESANEALDEALASVNNISRKKFLEIVDKLSSRQVDFEEEYLLRRSSMNQFLKLLSDATNQSSRLVGSLRGIYMSYSRSSSENALKAEPYYLDVDPDDQCLIAGRKSVHGAIREGIGIIHDQILYLLANEYQKPNISLLSVYLQLPFMEDIKLLKGIYLVPDYNKNPIARRIVLVKVSDEYSPEEFRNMESRLITNDELTEDLEAIYKYTCEREDSIRMCSVPSPKLDLRDLEMEKTLLRQSESLFEKE
jgi:hypothetical protein